jgi:hypothetical protein
MGVVQCHIASLRYLPNLNFGTLSKHQAAFHDPVSRGGSSPPWRSSSGPAIVAAGPEWRLSVGGVPDDDLLARVVAGRRRHVAVDHPVEFRRRQRHRDVVLAGVLRGPHPPGAKLKTVLARHDAEVGLAVFRSVVSVPSRLPSAFWVRVAIVAMVCLLEVARGPSPMTPKKGAGRRRHRAQRGEPPCGVDGMRRTSPAQGVTQEGMSHAAADRGDEPTRATCPHRLDRHRRFTRLHVAPPAR